MSCWSPFIFPSYTVSLYLSFLQLCSSFPPPVSPEVSQIFVCSCTAQPAQLDPSYLIWLPCSHPSLLHPSSPLSNTLPYPGRVLQLCQTRCPAPPGDKWELSHSGFVLAAGLEVRGWRWCGWNYNIIDDSSQGYSHLRRRWGKRAGFRG